MSIKFFFYGIICASVIWAIAVYLFYNLNEVNTYLLQEFVINSKESNTNHAKVIQRNLSDVLGLIKNKNEWRARNEGYKLYAFNILISESLEFNRSIPDTRNQLCKNQTYKDDLPSASVIICYFNEHFHTLIRSISSVLNRTPEKYLKEIILMDDFSDVPNLYENVSLFIQELSPKIKLIRLPERNGLIRSRIFASRRALGDVLIFLDSHIEVNIDWIQPLLQKITESNTTIAIPIIDMINADTFNYSSSHLVRGGFNLALHYKWDPIPSDYFTSKDRFIKPIKTATMAGGLFAIDRNYFREMGEYDDGMKIWGGENLEISFRIWMCGGSLEIMPCSRVGHVFRHRRPYGSPDGINTMLYNSLRLAHVWMDEYKDKFIKLRFDAKNYYFGDITKRIELRKTLNCKNFSWYLKNIYPESEYLTKNRKSNIRNSDISFQPWYNRSRNYKRSFQIRLSNTNYCLQSSEDNLMIKGAHVKLASCLKSKNQLWFETNRHEFILNKILCLQANKNKVSLQKCHESGANQDWKYTGEKESPIYNIAFGLCLSVAKPKLNEIIQLQLCSEKSSLFSWNFINHKIINKH